MSMNEPSQDTSDALPREAQSQLQRLLLERELHHILCRYARVCDERDWDAIDEVFDENASAHYGGRHLPDRVAILAMLRNNLGGCGPTQHLLGNLQVCVQAEQVTSRIEVRASHRGTGDKQDQTYECMGRYQDRWTQTPRGWRIVHRAMIVILEFGSRKVLGPAP